MSAMTDAGYIEQLKQVGERFDTRIVGRYVMLAYKDIAPMFTEGEAVRVSLLLSQGAAELRRRREERDADTTRSSI